jgi:hypothetical protein
VARQPTAQQSQEAGGLIMHSPPSHNTEADIKLAEQIVDAMKEYDVATATRNDKAVAAGKLLHEAHERHPTEEAFKKFLLLAGGVQIRRAQDLIALALGRKDFEKQQAENAAAQQRHRDKLKAEKIERDKAKPALPKPAPKPAGKGKPEPKPATPKPDALRNASAASLREFEFACKTYLPKLNNVSDLAEAKKLFEHYWHESLHHATKRKVA